MPGEYKPQITTDPVGGLSAYGIISQNLLGEEVVEVLPPLFTPHRDGFYIPSEAEYAARESSAFDRFDIDNHVKAEFLSFLCRHAGMHVKKIFGYKAFNYDRDGDSLTPYNPDNKNNTKTVEFEIGRFLLPKCSDFSLIAGLKEGLSGDAALTIRFGCLNGGPSIKNSVSVDQEFVFNNISSKLVLSYDIDLVRLYKEETDHDIVHVKEMRKHGPIRMKKIENESYDGVQGFKKMREKYKTFIDFPYHGYPESSPVNWKYSKGCSVNFSLGVNVFSLVGVEFSGVVDFEKEFVLRYSIPPSNFIAHWGSGEMVHAWMKVPRGFSS
ncbi:hypothetical protein [Halomonas sp. M4R1S46]|uniref:hypothetical protein n=1 Tax=Halomonas sp. M4R1S46 TaxID=2982692 RepID=UPI0021E3C51C|nr:hypothetical protein [Halomonas sp. M4R1S46]UYG06681.1 hypothetical protein OCT48_13745 [Halomonas sp. M4R1S46]